MKTCNITEAEAFEFIDRMTTIEKAEKGIEFIKTHSFPLLDENTEAQLLTEAHTKLDKLKEEADSSDDFDEYDEYDDYPSATRGDYSPSCPWNAPGMRVSDFIRGVR